MLVILAFVAVFERMHGECFVVVEEEWGQEGREDKARYVQGIVVRVYRKDNQDVTMRAPLVDPSQGYIHPSHVDGTDPLFQLS